MIRNILIGMAALMAAGSLFLAVAPRAPVREAPLGAGVPEPRIVIGANTMADVLAALDLEPVEIVHD